MRRSTVMRSRATDGRSASECQGKGPDQLLKHHSDGLECREPFILSHLGFQPVQKTPTIHASSGFIWGIPAKRNLRRVTVARAVPLSLKFVRAPKRLDEGAFGGGTFGWV
jgi:hypothetical protein